ncbi:hypothetical protein PUNSTDRAFT_84587 [Punctularia strigosozonata HHB-11173 SS5]|uniref:uncharacterized protein n=1 Tax=Punctularia strigosozonata (strain HHB-11173) TaxID=741275 RepID=UPI00044178DB|nr:uncharacterized protein PUNSTDRAFT_84587 [Punctularia strigosozonata HHB-11173 SS5]EIN10492.1 hypothetical protein PUNSTDRAFT_84587 [Punctularia strigosozonata HHB-11173 SS5]
MSAASPTNPDDPKPSRGPVYQVETTGSYWGDLIAAAKSMGQWPCTRNSLLSGIASGVGVGAIRAMSASILTSCNWAVGTFMLVSLGTWQVCQSARIEEHRRVQQVVEELPKRFAKRKADPSRDDNVSASSQ